MRSDFVKIYSLGAIIAFVDAFAWSFVYFYLYRGRGFDFGQILTFYALTCFIVGALILFIRNYKRSIFLKTSLLLKVAVYAAMPFITMPIQLYALAAIYALSLVMFFIPFNTIYLELTVSGDRALKSTMQFALWAIFGATVPSLTGVVVEYYGYTPIFLISAVILFFGFVLSTKIESKEAVKIESDKASKIESGKTAKIETDKAAKMESDKATEIVNGNTVKIENNNTVKTESNKAIKIENNKDIKIESDKATNVGNGKAIKTENNEVIKVNIFEAVKKFKRLSPLIFFEGVWSSITGLTIPLVTLLLVQEKISYGLFLSYLGVFGGFSSLIIGGISDRVRKRALFIQAISIPLGLSALLTAFGGSFAEWMIFAALVSMLTFMLLPFTYTLVGDISTNNIGEGVVARELFLNFGRVLGGCIMLAGFLLYNDVKATLIVAGAVLLAYPFIVLFAKVK